MDYRYKRTEKHILDACFKLSEKKDIYSLTVTEIAKEAEINRITFYSHYESIEALFEHVENLYIEEHLRVVSPIKDLILNPEAYLKRYVYGYTNYPITLFSNSSRKEHFMQKAINSIIDEVLKESENYDESFKKKITFIVYGIYGVHNKFEFNQQTINMLTNFINSVLNEQ